MNHIKIDMEPQHIMNTSSRYRVLWFGDPHFMKSCPNEYRLMASKIIEHAGICKPDLIVNAGDTFDTKEDVNLRVYCDVDEFIHQLSLIATTVVLVGNHDYEKEVGMNPDVHPFVTMKRMSNVIVANRACDLRVKIDDQPHRFVFVPYREVGRFNDELSTLDVPIESFRPTAVFGHQEMRGGSLNASGSRVSECGDVWPYHYPPIWLGHLHRYHKPSHNITYGGTPRQIKSDEDDDKAIMIIDFNSDGSYEETRIPLRVGLKRIVEIRADKIGEFVSSLGDLGTDVAITLKIRGPSSDVRAIMSSDEIKDLKRRGFKVHPIYEKQLQKKKTVPSNSSLIDILISNLDEKGRSVLADIINSD